MSGLGEINSMQSLSRADIHGTMDLDNCTGSYLSSIEDEEYQAYTPDKTKSLYGLGIQAGDYNIYPNE